MNTEAEQLVHGASCTSCCTLDAGMRWMMLRTIQTVTLDACGEHDRRATVTTEFSLTFSDPYSCKVSVKKRYLNPVPAALGDGKPER